MFGRERIRNSKGRPNETFDSTKSITAGEEQSLQRHKMYHQDEFGFIMTMHNF